MMMLGLQLMTTPGSTRDMDAKEHWHGSAGLRRGVCSYHRGALSNGLEISRSLNGPFKNGASVKGRGTRGEAFGEEMSLHTGELCGDVQ